MSYVLRSNTNWIISEFLPNEDSDITLILLDWLPSNISCKRDVMQKLASFWYSSIAPRYRWTWESEWTFLDHNPSFDIIEIIETIRNWEFKDLYNSVTYKLPSKKIVVVWVSFWWIVAIDCINKLEGNDKCVLLSPLCDMVTFTHDLKDVRDFVKQWFWRAYNFSLEDWNNMVDGNLFKTDYDLIKSNANKIHLIYDEKDSSILENDLLQFCERTNITNIEKLNWYGHLSYTKRDDDIYELIHKII